VGGTNFSFLVGEKKGSGVQVVPKIGLNAGGFVSIPLGGMFSVEPQLLFSSKGYAVKAVGTSYTAKAAIALNYIILPLFVNYTTASGVYVGAGPYAAMLVSAKSKYTVEGETESSTGTDGLNSFDAGLGAKVGYSHSSGLGASLGYEQGLVNVFDVDEDSDFKLLNSSVKLSFCYNFGK
jgi:hypothetical protein